MKRFLFIILQLLIIFCLTGCNLLTFTDTPVTKNNRDHLHSETLSYVIENEERLLSAIRALQKIPDNIQFLRRADEGNNILAWENSWTPVTTPITDDAICSLFDDSIHMISLGDAVVFDMGGMGNVTNSVYIGFYYSSHDVPLWIQAPDKYLHAPFIKKDNGWIADKRCCASDQSMKYYQLYTERIMDRFYYFELKL